jgi:hypothetical protein
MEKRGSPLKKLVLFMVFIAATGFLFAQTADEYACRELVCLRIIQGRTDPGGRLDGRAFLQILGRALTYTGKDAVP